MSLHNDLRRRPTCGSHFTDRAVALHFDWRIRCRLLTPPRGCGDTSASWPLRRTGTLQGACVTLTFEVSTAGPSAGAGIPRFGVIQVDATGPRTTGPRRLARVGSQRLLRPHSAATPARLSRTPDDPPATAPIQPGALSAAPSLTYQGRIERLARGHSHWARDMPGPGPRQWLGHPSIPAR